MWQIDVRELVCLVTTRTSCMLSAIQSPSKCKLRKSCASASVTFQIASQLDHKVAWLCPTRSKRSLTRWCCQSNRPLTVTTLRHSRTNLKSSNDQLIIWKKSIRSMLYSQTLRNSSYSLLLLMKRVISNYVWKRYSIIYPHRVAIVSASSLIALISR